MEAHDVRVALDGPPIWTSEDSTASFWRLASFNDGMVWVGHWSGQSPWERHLDGDEFLYVVEGDLEVVVLTDESPIQTTVRAGSIFVVPRGRWHRQFAHAAVMQLGVTTGRIEHSTAEHPGHDC